jgi:hypothetical protein
MARRRKTRTVYRYAKRGYRRSKSLLSGKVGHVIIGGVAGAVSPMIPQFVGSWTNPLVFGGLGVVMKKPQLLTIAGYEVGKMLVGGGLLGGGSQNGGLFE